jgi:putative Mg2+ transporter-C (MgtC) family protein
MEISLSLDYLSAYWSAEEVAANIVIFMNLAGAMLLGLIVGYERSYHGRAAGMRTYGLVCTASAALIIISGFPTFWFGGHALAAPMADPTRVIQGVVTGIGFLGAGVIMKEGFSISGLSTAASIWTTSAIGILVGVGFYATAILVTALSVISMMWVYKLENWLPSRKSIYIKMRFLDGFRPIENRLDNFIKDNGYEIASGTLAIGCSGKQAEWSFIAIAQTKDTARSLPILSDELNKLEGVESFQLARARN